MLSEDLLSPSGGTWVHISADGILLVSGQEGGPCSPVLSPTTPGFDTDIDL